MDARHSIPNSFSSAGGGMGPLAPPGEPPVLDEQARFEIIMKHGHRDLVQAVAFNTYGDRCATGSVDGEVRVFNRHRDGVWKLCDSWMAHGGEVLELQWLPPTIYPNLLASLGFDGLFKLWVEDPVAAPGRRFGQRSKTDASAAFETRSPGAPYRSFSLKHNDVTRHTYLALLAADGTLSVLENEVPENLSDYTDVDELRVCAKPARGEEASFRVCFDPNPDPCYTALRAGVAPDALSLVVAAMDSVKIYRSRPVAKTAYGLEGRGQAFYLAAEIEGHRGLVRDVAWAPGNFRGYDILATACQDGYVRVVRLETPFSAATDGKSWAAADVVPKVVEPVADSSSGGNGGNGTTARRRRDTRHSVSSLLSTAATSHSSPSLIAAGAAAAAAGSGLAPTSPANPHAASTPVSVSSSASSTARDGASAEPVPETTSASVAAATDNAGGSKDGPASANTSFASSGLSATTDSSTGPASTAGTAGGEGSGGAGPGGVGSSGAAAAGGGATAPGATAPGHGQAVADRRFTGRAGEVRHTVREVCRLENERTPVWRVSFDDDGQILGSVGDDGKLVCYRQKPDGVWARSSELTVMKTRRV